MQEPQTEAVQKEPAGDLLTRGGGHMAAERWQFCHTAAAARGCLGNETGSYLYPVVEDMKRDDCGNPFKKRSF